MSYFLGYLKEFVSEPVQEINREANILIEMTCLIQRLLQSNDVHEIFESNGKRNEIAVLKKGEMMCAGFFALVVHVEHCMP